MSRKYDFSSKSLRSQNKNKQKRIKNSSARNCGYQDTRRKSLIPQTNEYNARKIMNKRATEVAMNLLFQVGLLGCEKTNTKDGV